MEFDVPSFVIEVQSIIGGIMATKTLVSRVIYILGIGNSNRVGKIPYAMDSEKIM